MGNTGSHWRFQYLGTQFRPLVRDFPMDRGTDGGTIYEQSSGRVRKKVVRPEIDAAHRSIIRDYRENSFRVTAHLGNGLGSRTSKFSGQFRRNLLISVKNC